MKGRRAAMAGLAAVIAIGCGGGQTRGEAADPVWHDDNGASAASFQRDFQSTLVPRGASVAVGVSGADKIVGAPLDGGPAWTFSHPLDSRPAVTGAVVIGLGGGELFALEATTGKLLWKRAAGGLLRGAGDDGAITVVSLLPATGLGSVVLAIDHDGDVVRQILDQTTIGVPAVVDGYAFLPWQGQYVTVYDLRAGEERARILFRVLTSRALTEGGAIFFGEDGLTRFDDRIGLARQGGATRITLPARSLPGDPRWMRSGADTPELTATGVDKVRLYARPAPSGRAGIDGGRYAATFYRVAVGLDAASGEIAWAHANGADFLGGDAFAGGFALCDAAGKVTFLDGKRGAITGEISLGAPITACVVQADAVTRAAPESSPALADQLSRATLIDDEPELVPIQRILLKDLAKIDGATATRTLIAISEGEHSSPLVEGDARALLAARRTSPEVMLEALGRRYDYLASAVRPPPVGPLADALAAMRETRAAPLLAAHLDDPADSADDVRRAAAALAILATKAERDALRGFFARYRCMSAADVGEAIIAAVISTAEALTKIGDGDTVVDAATDPFTSAQIRQKLADLLKGRPERSASRRLR